MESKFSNSKLNWFVSKVLLTIILIFISLIYIKSNNKNLANYKKVVFENNFSFATTRKLFNRFVDHKLIGHPLNEKLVFGETSQVSQKKFKNGVQIKYGTLNPVSSLQSGIVVYIGPKADLGPTIIIQGVDGYDVWYSNLKNSNVNIYDYVEKAKIIGETSEVIITISKNGNFVDYDEYTKKV